MEALEVALAQQRSSSRMPSPTPPTTLPMPAAREPGVGEQVVLLEGRGGTVVFPSSLLPFSAGETSMRNDIFFRESRCRSAIQTFRIWLPSKWRTCWSSQSCLQAGEARESGVASHGRYAGIASRVRNDRKANRDHLSCTWHGMILAPPPAAIPSNKYRFPELQSTEAFSKISPAAARRPLPPPSTTARPSEISPGCKCSCQ